MGRGKKRKLFRLDLILLLGVVLLLAYGATASITSLAIFEEQIKVGIFTRATCTADRDRPVAILDIQEVDDSGQTFVCDPKTIYIPGDDISLASDRECIFSIKRPEGFGIAFLTGDICEIGGKKCDNIIGGIGLLSTDLNNYKVKVPIDKELKLNPTTAFAGEYTIKGTAVPWRLRVVNDVNYLDWTNSCTIASLGRSSIDKKVTYDTLDRDEVKTLSTFQGVVVAPGETIQVVTASSTRVTGRAITRDDINNGDPIYIMTVGQYYLIKEADDGSFYVDLRTPFYSDKIECVPGLFCDSEGRKLVKPEEQKCSELLGNYQGYVPISNNEACLYECATITGTPLRTTNCIQYGSQCPAKQPFWDSIKGECVGNAPIIPIYDFGSLVLPLIILMVGLLGGVGLWLYRRSKKK